MAPPPLSSIKNLLNPRALNAQVNDFRKNKKQQETVRIGRADGLSDGHRALQIAKNSVVVGAKAAGAAKFVLGKFFGRAGGIKEADGEISATKRAKASFSNHGVLGLTTRALAYGFGSVLGTVYHGRDKDGRRNVTEKFTRGADSVNEWIRLGTNSVPMMAVHLLVVLGGAGAAGAVAAYGSGRVIKKNAGGGLKGIGKNFVGDLFSKPRTDLESASSTSSRDDLSVSGDKEPPLFSAARGEELAAEAFVRQRRALFGNLESAVDAVKDGAHLFQGANGPLQSHLELLEERREEIQRVGVSDPAALAAKNGVVALLEVVGACIKMKVSQDPTTPEEIKERKETLGELLRTVKDIAATEYPQGSLQDKMNGVLGPLHDSMQDTWIALNNHV